MKISGVFKFCHLENSGSVADKMDTYGNVKCDSSAGKKKDWACLYCKIIPN